MNNLTFDEFKKILVDDDEKSLRDMAKEQGIALPGKCSRDWLLKSLYDKTTPDGQSPVITTSEILPDVAPAGVAYKVVLKALQPRARGGRRWDVGLTEVAESDMSEDLKAALASDKGFTVFKVEG